jgi:two-component system, NarL family, nitrate/nitrite response regulator NarL
MAEDNSPSAAAGILILIVCSVRLYRDAIAAVLRNEADITVCGCAHPDEGILAAYDATAPDVVLVDTGAFEFAVQLTRVRPRARVLGVGVHDLPVHVVACAQAGLSGYVPNTASIEEVVNATRRIASGETVCSASMAGGLFRHVRGTAINHHLSPAGAVLTQRQQQIVRLLADGVSNKEIARRLSLGTSTVKNHVHEILDRLNVTSRNQVAACIHRHG